MELPVIEVRLPETAGVENGWNFAIMGGAVKTPKELRVGPFILLYQRVIAPAPPQV